jgi:hypothetical protein
MLYSMVWESTDNFGNLMVANSSATTLEALQPDLYSLCSELFARHAGEVKITVDRAFGQIGGPEEFQVSHVLNVPSLSKLLPDGIEPLIPIIASIASELGRDGVSVVEATD